MIFGTYTNTHVTKCLLCLMILIKRIETEGYVEENCQ